MYFHCVFFHIILTVVQNTQRTNFAIIPKCYSVYLVVFAWECLSTPGAIELFLLKLLFCSKLYSGSEYTDTVLLFDFMPLALIVHTCI